VYVHADCGFEFKVAANLRALTKVCGDKKNGADGTRPAAALALNFRPKGNYLFNSFAQNQFTGVFRKYTSNRRRRKAADAAQAHH
jgi:hypothetical protein